MASPHSIRDISASPLMPVLLRGEKSLFSVNVPNTLLSGLATSEVATLCVIQENMREIKSI